MFELVRRWIDRLAFLPDGLVHDRDDKDAFALRLHRSFIASHLYGGALAIPAAVFYGLSGGTFNLLTLVVFCWLSVPALIAVFVSKTGRLALGHCFSSLNLAGMVSFAMYFTGGIASPLAPWMLLVPMEGALSGERRVVVFAIVLAIFSAGSIFLLGQSVGLPETGVFTFPAEMVAFVALISACAYGAGLALKIDGLHRESMERLQLSEARHRLLSENASDLMTLHDRHGDVLYASAAGGGKEEGNASSFLGDGLVGRIEEEDCGKYQAALRLAMRQDGPVSARFRLLPAADGNGFMAEGGWSELRVRKVDRTSGFDAPDGWAMVGVTRDIRFQQQQEMALQAARDEAEGVGEMKSNFLATVGHELKTPLNAVIGFSRMLETELKKRSELDDLNGFAEQVSEGGQQLSRLVDDILDVARLEAGRFRLERDRLNFHEVIEASVRAHAAELKRRDVDVDIAIGRQLPVLFADERAVRQILSVLISNAVTASSDGGRISLKAFARGAEIVLSVVDHGRGMSADLIETVGKPFVQVGGTAKAGRDLLRGQEGLGLGLAKVNGLMQLHGGEMRIESEVGSGTCVQLIFPARQDLLKDALQGGVSSSSSRLPLSRKTPAA